MVTGGNAPTVPRVAARVLERKPAVGQAEASTEVPKRTGRQGRHRAPSPRKRALEPRSGVKATGIIKKIASSYFRSRFAALADSPKGCLERFYNAWRSSEAA